MLTLPSGEYYRITTPDKVRSELAGFCAIYKHFSGIDHSLLPNSPYFNGKDGQIVLDHRQK